MVSGNYFMGIVSKRFDLAKRLVIFGQNGKCWLEGRIIFRQVAEKLSISAWG